MLKRIIYLLAFILLIICLQDAPFYAFEQDSNCKCPPNQKWTGRDCEDKKGDEICFTLFDPVCGCDEIIYGNSCEAYLNGIKKFTNGACVESDKKEKKFGMKKERTNNRFFVSAETNIRTTDKDIQISHLDKGDLVISTDDVHAKVKNIKKKKTKGQKVLRVTFNDGTIIEVNSKHKDLKMGDLIDGRMVTGIRLVPYNYKYTYSIEPDSASETYYANGILIHAY